jgi:hypothetical protein
VNDVRKSASEHSQQAYLRECHRILCHKERLAANSLENGK